MANLSNINGKFVVEQSTGFVGIGITDPSQLLHLQSTADTILKIDNITSGTGKSYLLRSTTAGSFIIRDEDASSNRLLINTSGNATFAGTVTAPTFSGDLNGTINTVTTATTKGNSTNDTTVATTAFVQNVIGTIPAGLVFQGTWNASTNTPTLTSGSGTTGNFYIVSVAGSTNLDGITDWQVGDWAVFIEQGASDQWEKIDNSSVLSGSGTGGSFAGWSGSGTSVTLGNAPVTFSGNNSTFAGDINIAAGKKLQYSANSFITPENNVTGAEISTAGDFRIKTGTTPTLGLTIGGTQNATFAGNVGIVLTNTNSVKLGITGNSGLPATSGTTQTGLLRLKASNNATLDMGCDHTTAQGWLQVTDVANLSLEYNLLLQPNGGNVGIGTDSPTSYYSGADNLVVKQASGEGGMSIVTANDTTGAIYFADGTSGNEQYRGGIGYTHSTDKLFLVSGGQTRAWMNDSGNVGIGTDSPDTILNLNKTGGAIIRLQSGVTNTADGLYGGIEWYNTDPTTDGPEVVSNIMSYQNDANGRGGYITFGTTNGFDGVGSPTERMRIASDGQVNITKGSSGTVLYLDGTNAYDAETGIQLSVGRAKISGFLNTTGGTPGSSLRFYTMPDSGSVTERMRITSSGDVQLVGNKYLYANPSAGSTTIGAGFQLDAVNNIMKLWTNNVERMRIDSSGKSTFYSNEIEVYASSSSASLILNSGDATKDEWTIVSTDLAGDAYLRFVDTTTATTVMSLRDNGNVGIGTDSPSFPLEVDGGSGDGIKIKAGNSSNDDSFLVANNADSTLFLVDGDGNVGIGTTTPLHDLQIGTAATNGSYSMMIEGNFANTALSSNPRLNLIDTNFGITAGKYGSGGTDDAIGIFAFQGAGRGILFAHTTAGSGTALQGMRHDMFVDGGTGNVGIGTTSPDDMLDVENGNIRLRSNSEGNTGLLRMFDASGTESGQIYPASGDLKIYSPNDVLFTQSGNVGIGTNFVSAKLQVHSTNAGQPTVPLFIVNESTTVGTEARLGFAANTNNDIASGRYSYISTVNTSGSNGQAMTFATNESGASAVERMRISSSGDVGIGVTPESASRLHVKYQAGDNNCKMTLESNNSGDSFINYSAASNEMSAGFDTSAAKFVIAGGDNLSVPKFALTQSTGTLEVTGDVIAYGSPSDKRLKENIKSIDSALDKVMKLKGVTFDWIQKKDQILNIKEDIGFIAQDVQKVVPELVRENEDGMLSMRHQGIAPILLEAIKELKAEIEELKLNKCNCNK